MKKTLQTLLLLFACAGVSFAQITVSLTVDASNETVDATGVHVAGNWDSANEWNPSAFPMNDNGDGTWSLDLTVDENATFEYKFLLGNDWGLGNEGINDKAGCIVGNGNSNRILTVGTENMTVPTVCYNSCASCAGADQQTVTFKVDLSAEPTINDPVYLSGNFPEMWNEAYPMRDDNNDMVYTTTLVLDAGDYEFKYRNGADGWESVPTDCNVNGNRSVTVADEDVYQDVVCINKCGPCVATNTLNVTMLVDMTNVIATTGISPDGVSVAGDFQSAASVGGNWSPGEAVMTDTDGDNIYEISFQIAEGEYAYKFLNGNAWGTEESIPSDCQLPGTGNRPMVIAGENGENVTIGPFCFSACEAECPELKDPINVTFQVDMTNEFVAAEGLFVTGDFIEGAKWDRDSLELTETATAGLWSTSFMVRPGKQYSFIFTNGGMESTDENHDFLGNGCGIDNGFGGSNRLLDLTTTESDTVLAAFIYNSCDLSPLVNANEELDYAQDIKVYPTPVQNIWNVTFGNEINKQHKVNIYSVTGQLVINTNMVSDKNIQVDVSQLQQGMYMAKITNDAGQSAVFKMIKN